MSRQLYIVDTHALLWFFTNDKRLSRRAGGVLDRGASGDASVLISTISLAEALRLIETGRVRMTGRLLDLIDAAAGFHVVPFDLATFREMTRLERPIEIHDRAIAATAMQHGGPLITKDPEFKGAVPTLW